MTIHLTFPDGCAFVAGGTGNVGAGVVSRWAEAGLDVVFTYRSNREAAEALEKDLTGRGLTARAVRMDTADEASIDTALDLAEEFAGPLRTVACTTGAVVPFNRIADFTIAEVESFVSADALACYRVLHSVIPRLRANGGGSITVATTIATARVIEFDGVSPFSKGAVQALVRQIAAEEAEHNIRCNDVAIGLIADASLEQIASTARLLDSPTRERFEALMAQMRGLVKLGRPGSPREAGDLFAFLASDQAAFITGQRIAIDGGLSL